MPFGPQASWTLVALPVLRGSVVFTEEDGDDVRSAAGLVIEQAARLEPS